MQHSKKSAVDGATDVSGSGTGTLGKAMALLDLVAAADAPLRFVEILALTQQPRGTVHRQLSHLVEEGLLALREDLRYEPGIRLLTLASNAWSRNQFRAVAEPHLKRLQEQTGETIHLGILRGLEVIYLDKVEGRQAIRMHSQIGNASPVYCTGVGKAALSVLDEGKLLEVMGQLIFHPYTPSTHRSVRSLMEDIVHIKKRGYAFDREEHERGICCVAAPVHSRHHGIVAGISVTGPVHRLPAEKLEAWAGLVDHAAVAISADLVARLGPGR
ncbi:IclR family transcriptional regulator [Pararhizobium sp.]|uniref:IclR family transcriptional regulator n=1 Tax=Pararhizobium sp. TaxID=1977563 RepID=UPI002722825B|nr:IclR family transcriptional regulator [Pararhizobium sp.]MDO9415659.1 IclR family transcriptional regulator [Pararhizobium sp.]